ncbi:hypothetical protein HVIM_04195 [Roseomonas mucosa]|nr:hypothetical protein HVIM_04195 [Roseomonas mucosa]QDD98627.1 hypothetical protein ADP8_04195 [Roseomonas mucosa]UZO90821.1 hypothetical protein RMP42_04195 [Roseomonas mucosa]
MWRRAETGRHHPPGRPSKERRDGARGKRPTPGRGAGTGGCVPSVARSRTRSLPEARHRHPRGIAKHLPFCF